MHRLALATILTTVAFAGLAACNNINIDLDQTQNNGCCCNTCGCNDGGAGGTTTTNTCGCPDGYQPTPAGDACVRQTSVPPIQNATTYDVCPGDTKWVFGRYGAKVEPGGTPPGGTTESNAYWGDGTMTPINGRLNDVGVWACAAGSSSAGTNPVGEWIGFSVCLDIAVSGDYILGIAADNRVRMHVDSALVFEHDTGATSAFDYWHLRPIHLTSGIHIIELRGRNDGEIAAFGAEISGPFASGSLNTDADVLDEVAYDSHLIWSTGNLPPGQVFQLGENSGWSCPNGTALDVCAPAPICTDIDYVPCNGAAGTGGAGTGDTGLPPTTKQ